MKIAVRSSDGIQWRQGTLSPRNERGKATEDRRLGIKFWVAIAGRSDSSISIRVTPMQFDLSQGCFAFGAHTRVHPHHRPNTFSSYYRIQIEVPADVRTQIVGTLFVVDLFRCKSRAQAEVYANQLHRVHHRCSHLLRRSNYFSPCFPNALENSFVQFLLNSLIRCEGSFLSFRREQTKMRFLLKFCLENII